jgi:hypothetical protein
MSGMKSVRVLIENTRLRTAVQHHDRFGAVYMRVEQRFETLWDARSRNILTLTFWAAIQDQVKEDS